MTHDQLTGILRISPNPLQRIAADRLDEYRSLLRKACEEWRGESLDVVTKRSMLKHNIEEATR
jgi:hypothetical protein